MLIEDNQGTAMDIHEAEALKRTVILAVDDNSINLRL